MKRKFVMMPIFDKQWRDMGLDDIDLQNLQAQLLKNPQIGSVIRGTGKLRKMRFALPGKGKSGQAVFCMLTLLLQETIY